MHTHRGFLLPIFKHCAKFAQCFFHAVLAHVGRAPVSKTGCRRSKPCKRCHVPDICVGSNHRRGQCVPCPQPDADGELRHQTEVLQAERSFHHETRRRKEQDPRHYRGAAELAHAGERQRYHPGEISIHTLLAESDTLGGNQGRCGISIHTRSQGMT